MTKRQILMRYVLFALLGAAVTAALDATVVARRARPGGVADRRCVRERAGAVHVRQRSRRTRRCSAASSTAPASTNRSSRSPSTTGRRPTPRRACSTRCATPTRAPRSSSSAGTPSSTRDRRADGARGARDREPHATATGSSSSPAPREITRELLRTHRLLLASGARPPRLFRAPHGFRNPVVVRVARRLGYRVVGWTKGVFDTALPGADVIAERSRKALRPGAILLLHDADGNGDGDRSQTADALPAILRDVAGGRAAAGDRVGARRAGAGAADLVEADRASSCSASR